MKLQTIWLKRNLNATLFAVPMIELAIISMNGMPLVRSAKLVQIDKGNILVSFEWLGRRPGRDSGASIDAFRANAGGMN
ncbi:hypothetical protein [Lysobacter capsici]|uniref:hypothetical protein n=1 Tax=Lysobacter capsici TaxID=435897 RepID=UPI00287B8F79|nr:hypothetical protein [Lysobacter capsici]WND80403.1 hypothetical protein RJ610_24535 [Lysobacter capsici]WND85600.1 hypothetical protein RJ609_24555 [Lysobacter capsici]